MPDHIDPKSSTLDQKRNVRVDDQTNFCEDSLIFPLRHSSDASNIKLDISKTIFLLFYSPQKSADTVTT